MATTTAQVQQLYVAYLGRAADKAGLDYWTNELNATPATLTLEDLRANFVNEQAEYAAIYGGLSREDTVAQIYTNLFGRPADADGLAYWTTGGGASVNVDLLLTAFINGASATDSQTVTNKVLVAEIYTGAAGDNFLAADAATIISGVTTNASISTALNLLSNGSLSGIAIPAGISALQADIVADAAVTAFETNNVTTLSDLSKELFALSVTNDKAGIIGNTVVSTATVYGTQATALEAAITAARAQNTLDTETLTTKLATDTKTLATERTDFLTGETNAVAKINAYDAAVKAVAANPGADSANSAQAVTTLDAYATNSNNTAAFAAAVKAAGLADGSDAQDVYDALASATATDATITKISTAFGSINEFASVKTQAALDHSANVASASLTEASAALTSAVATDWKDAYDAVTEDNAFLTASKAIDALEAKYDVTDTAHTSLETAATGTQAAVNGNAAIKAITATAGSTTAGTANSDVFHFVNKIDQANDVTVTFNAKDTLFLGEGYSLNSTATVDTTSGFLTGGDNNKLEVFFVQDGANVKAVVETSVTGSTTAVLGAAAATDGAAVITLTGVTVAELTFANGVISHVA